MFSRRTGWNREVNRLGARLEQLRAEGRPLLDLAESNPTRVGLHPAPEALLQALSSPELVHYEPDPRGLRSAREALARKGLLSPESLLLTASTSEAYAWLFKLLCDPGDDVLIPTPSYPLFEFLTGLESVGTRAYPLRFDGEWHIDLASLEEAAGPRTRAVLVVNPGNPTGAYLKRSELEALWELCARHDWALLSDEVFSPYGVQPAPPDRVTQAATPDARALTFSLGGLSKMAGLPQLKLGWIITSGPAELREEALARLELVADSYLSVNAPVQLGVPSLLELAEEVQQRIRARVEANRAMLGRHATREKSWSLLPSEGGWSALIRVPARFDEEALCLQLLDEGVIVQPGYFFDFPEGRWIVLSLLPEERVFAEGIARVVHMLDGSEEPQGVRC
ncbi:MAG: pyridoxal phosphate-dependent aminotransferase [Myxococcaceae bacterium]